MPSLLNFGFVSEEDEIQEAIQAEIDAALQEAMFDRLFLPRIYNRLNHYCPYWKGSLSFLSTSVKSIMFFVEGQNDIAHRALRSLETIRLTRKLALINESLIINDVITDTWTPQVDLEKKLANYSEYSVLVLAPAGDTSEEIQENIETMKENIISYFIARPSYAVLYTNDGDTSFMVHFFPPCIWSKERMDYYCPELKPLLLSYGIMLIIITAHFTGNLVTYNPGAKYRAIKSDDI